MDDEDGEDVDTKPPKDPSELLKMELDMKVEQDGGEVDYARDAIAAQNLEVAIKDEPEEDNGDTFDQDDDEEMDEEDEDYRPEPRRPWKYDTEYMIGERNEGRKYKKRKKSYCDICDKSFATPTGLEKHNIIKHPERLPFVDSSESYSCNQCDMVYPMKDHLRYHKKYVHEGKEEKCDVCEEVFKNKRKLGEHRRTYHSDMEYPCDKCHLKFKLNKRLQEHVRQVHDQEKSHLCSECGKAFFSKYKLKHHMASIHLGTSTEVCDQCGQVTKNIYLHRREKHPPKKELDAVTAKCESCEATFSNAKDLNHHQLTLGHITSQFVYKCSMCESEWVSASAVCKHYAEIHGNLVFACDHCAYIANNKKNWEHHRKGIHKIDPYQCDQCAKTFSSMITLKRHLAVPHQGSSQTYRCKRCDVVTTTFKEMYQHTKAEHPKDIKCDQCNFMTASQSSLAAHKWRFHQARAYNCPHCDKAFTKPSSLSSHVSNVHENPNKEK